MSDSDSARPQGDAASLHQSPIENPHTEGTTDERHCSHIREDGSRCKGWKMRGSDLCAGHAGRGIAANPSAYAREGAAVSAEVRQERAEVAPKSYKQALQAAWEQHAAAIVARRLDIITNGSDADALRAIEAMESRIYGKPKETVEQVTTPRTVEAIRSMTADERRQLLHQLEAEGRMPVLRAVSSED